MSLIYTSCAFFGAFLVYLVLSGNARILKNPYFIIITTGLLVRFFASNVPISYDSDIACFKSWSMMLAEDGLSNFYTADAFTDYPPGYMYVLLLIGGIRKFLSLPYDSAAFTMLIKMPAMVFDILTGLLIYRVAKKNNSDFFALGVSLLYLFNPAVIPDSAVWGQVDSVYTFFLALSLVYLVDKRYLPSFLTITVAVVIKPQSLIIAPIFLYAIYKLLKEKGNFLRLVRYALACLVLVIVLFLPFTKRFDFTPIFKQYIETLSSYAYASVNAYNFYAFIGANWTPIENPMLFFSYNVWGTIFIVIIVAISLIRLYKDDSTPSIFFVAGMIITLTFMFSVKMHERYIFPALVFFLLSFTYSKDKLVLLLHGFFSLTLLINMADILNVFSNGQNYELIKKSMPFVSLMNLIFTVIMLVKAFVKFNPIDETSLQPDKDYGKLGRLDLYLCGSLTLVYAIVAFINLGNLTSPQTLWTGDMGTEVVFDLGADGDTNIPEVNKIRYMMGPINDKTFTIMASSDNINYLPVAQSITSSAFNWGEYVMPFKTRYAKLISTTERLMLCEIAFYDPQGNILPVKVMNEANSALVDEQYAVPDDLSYMSGSYFDEIYHARTAYEYIKGYTVYETTHPPLGKIIIAAGIKLFGLSPFGWRFPGTLFGVLMLPFIYLFARELFKNQYWAFFSTFIFAFDFMHYAQTRISTIDTYIVFFVIGMYYFMYKYIQTKSLVPLFFSGLFMGLGIASKWPGVYAGAGLAVVFFVALYEQYKENKNISVVVKTLSLCILAFIVVPVIIYVLSYIPYINSMAQKPLTLKSAFKTVIDSQTLMFNYHAHLISTHPYSSPWWEWPFILRPIFYYAKRYNETTAAGISSFGNPAVWWLGLVALFFCIRKYFTTRDKNLLFLVVGFFAQYLPWMLVTRTTYIYHYFPCVPFLVLMITYFFKTYVHIKRPKLTFVYLGTVLVLFIIFYPVLTGVPVNLSFVINALRWFKTWQLA